MRQLLTHRSLVFPLIAAETMADQADAATVTENVVKLVLDDVTGEMVSKSELKKREKKRLNDAKKVEPYPRRLGERYITGGKEVC